MPVDLYRDTDRYVLNADLPGVDPGSVDVDGQLLTIRAQRTAGSYLCGGLRRGHRLVASACEGHLFGPDPGDTGHCDGRVT